MNNKVYAEVLKLAENVGLQVKKGSDDAYNYLITSGVFNDQD